MGLNCFLRRTTVAEHLSLPLLILCSIAGDWFLDKVLMLTQWIRYDGSASFWEMYKLLQEPFAHRADWCWPGASPRGARTVTCGSRTDSFEQMTFVAPQKKLLLEGWCTILITNASATVVWLGIYGLV